MLDLLFVLFNPNDQSFFDINNFIIRNLRLQSDFHDISQLAHVLVVLWLLKLVFQKLGCEVYEPE